ncbi:HAD hydrolase family protein [Vibrio lentus]|nr:HAD hydrolase family protein [Vibrio lentus]
MGIEAIAKHLGITAEEVICMGDAEAVTICLNTRAWALQMENAMEETKKLANYITASNDDHGVALAIEEVYLQLIIAKVTFILHNTRTTKAVHCTAFFHYK